MTTSLPNDHVSIRYSIQDPKTQNDTAIHPKGWGHELWIVNNEKYCGKLLKFEKGKKCSWHYHKLKDETFWLQSGAMLIYFGESDDFSKAQMRVFKPGDSFHVYQGLRHQMIAIEESELFEFSTQHFDSDSYRIQKGD
jgi:quercetin dioxygenase-like cupin family protein